MDPAAYPPLNDREERERREKAVGLGVQYKNGNKTDQASEAVSGNTCNCTYSVTQLMDEDGKCEPEVRMPASEMSKTKTIYITTNITTYTHLRIMGVVFLVSDSKTRACWVGKFCLEKKVITTLHLTQFLS